MKNWLKNLLAKSCTLDIAALLLGVLLTFAFAPYEVFPLAVIAPAGLIALWLGASPKRAFWRGFLFGAGLFGAGVYWVFISIHVIGEVPVSLSGIITAGMIAILSLYPALVGYTANRYFPGNTSTKIICVYPAIWLMSEWLRSFLLTGFPWLFLGYSQTNSPLKGYAAILSVYGITLALMLSSALIVNAVIKYRQKDYRSIYFSLFAVMAIWTAGGLLNFAQWTRPEGKPVSVALVQGNIEQTIKWSPEHLQTSVDTYTQLSEPLWGKEKLIIWPEAAIPLPLPAAEPLINALDAKANASGSELILGIPMRAEQADGYWNTIVTLGKDKSVYLKRHLVPFGEYTPFYNLFSSTFNFLNLPLSNTVPGNIEQNTLNIGNLKILPSICYEIAFPSLIRSNDKSISMLLSITNDAWFGKSNAQAQHLQMAQMRALEFARPVLFVGNDGITAIIGADGIIQSAAPQREAYILTGTVQPRYGLTPWMRNGTDPILFIMLSLLAAAIIAKRKELQQSNKDKMLRTVSE